MEVQKLEATLETRISSKSGKPYQVVILKLTDTYEKPVFLEPAEVEILKLAQNNSAKVDNFPEFL